MLRGIAPEDAPFSSAIALRTQAQNFLRLALDSDDRPLQGKYLDAAREALTEMEIAIERSRIDSLKGIDARFPCIDLASENANQMEIKNEHNSDDEDEEYDSDEEEEISSECEEDQEWGKEDDRGSEEEEWDINNGENSSQSPEKEDPQLTHYFANGPGENKPDMTTLAGIHVDRPVQQTIQVSNLDVRVYARMMELFEIESRHRMSICNSELRFAQSKR